MPAEPFAQKTEESTQPPPKGPQGPEALEEAGHLLTEISEFLSYYLKAQVDRVKLSARETLLGLAILPIFYLTLAGIFLLALGFISYGSATYLNTLFPGKNWAGFLLTGVLWLLLFLGLLVGLNAKRKRQSLRLKAMVHQAKVAKAGMESSARDLSHILLQAANLCAWTEQYPLPTLGAAAFTGFMVVPPKSATGVSQPSGDRTHLGSELGLLLLNTGLAIAKDVLTPVLTDMLKENSRERNDGN